MKSFFTLLIFFLIVSCKQSGHSSANIDDARNEIKITFDNYYSDIRKEGLLAELKYLDSSTQFFWVPPGYLNYAGYNSIAAAIRESASLLKSIDNRYDSLLIVPLTNEYAQFVVRTISTAVAATGDTSKTAFIESGVMVKRENGWKFLSGQTSILK